MDGHAALGKCCAAPLARVRSSVVLTRVHSLSRVPRSRVDTHATTQVYPYCIAVRLYYSSCSSLSRISHSDLSSSSCSSLNGISPHSDLSRSSCSSLSGISHSDLSRGRDGDRARARHAECSRARASGCSGGSMACLVVAVHKESLGWLHIRALRQH